MRGSRRKEERGRKIGIGDVAAFIERARGSGRGMTDDALQTTTENGRL